MRVGARPSPFLTSFLSTTIQSINEPFVLAVVAVKRKQCRRKDYMYTAGGQGGCLPPDEYFWFSLISQHHSSCCLRP